MSAGGPGFTLEQLREAFFNFDGDRDGAISVEDMKVILMSKGAKMSREEVCTIVSSSILLANAAL